MASTLTKEERLELAAKRKAEKNLSVAPKTEAEPSYSSGLLQKVGTLGAPSTLVFGNSGSGKSTVVRDIVLAKGYKPLWLPLNNTGALTIPEVADWDTAMPNDWDEFIKGLYQPVIRGELSGYDVLVIDGGDVLTQFAVSKEAPSGQAERGDWLRASNHVRDAIVKLRGKFKELYMIVDVIADKETGGRKINLNPYAKNTLVPLFGQKFYTQIVKERDADKKLTGKISYTVQKNSDLSLNFVAGTELTLDSK